MKPKLTTVALIIGLAFGVGPWVFLENPSRWWYPVSVFGGLLVCISGMGAQMKQMGQGDTGEELLQSIWNWVKKKVGGS